jgi:hypothetical protein
MCGSNCNIFKGNGKLFMGTIYDWLYHRPGLVIVFLNLSVYERNNSDTMIQQYLAQTIVIIAIGLSVFSLLRFIYRALQNRKNECGSNCGCSSSGKLLKVNNYQDHSKQGKHFIKY